MNLIKTNSDNVFKFSSGKKLCTKSFVEDISDDNTFLFNNEKYRIWDGFHSKLAAIILKEKSISIKKDSSILYLGAANGTTVSYVSDIVSSGVVFAVEFSPRSMHDLINVSSQRQNIFPIFADASRPEIYKNRVPKVDIIYQDIAQRHQAKILIRNAKLFLKKDGFLIFIIKSRSIDSTKKISYVFDMESEILKKDFDIKNSINLKPFYSDHLALCLKNK